MRKKSLRQLHYQNHNKMKASLMEVTYVCCPRNAKHKYRTVYLKLNEVPQKEKSMTTIYKLMEKFKVGQTQAFATCWSSARERERER